MGQPGLRLKPGQEGGKVTPLFKKLNLGSNTTLAVLNAPGSFEEELNSFSDCTLLRKIPRNRKVPFAIGFAVTQAELDNVSEQVSSGTEGDAVVWIAYPKRSSKKYQCEFDRDTGWEAMGKAGFEPVRQVAIDADWSALRFRRTEFIKTLSRSNAMAISDAGKRRTTGPQESSSQK